MKHIQIAKRIGALALCAALTVGVLTMGAGAAGTNVIMEQRGPARRRFLRAGPPV